MLNDNDFCDHVKTAKLASNAISSTSHYLPTRGPFALPHLSHVSFVSRYILSDVNGVYGYFKNMGVCMVEPKWK